MLFPLVASPFVVFQLGAQSLILGMIALSLMVLAGYGGMVSMAQLTVAGVAGYAVAILGPNSTGVLGFNWPWEIYVPVAILIGGDRLRADRRDRGAHRRHLHDHDHARDRRRRSSTSRSRTIRCSTAIPGFAGVAPPESCSASSGATPSRSTISALLSPRSPTAAVLYARALDLRPGAAWRSRDNPRRARAVGYDVTALRVAAFFFAGLIAGAAGVL